MGNVDPGRIPEVTKTNKKVKKFHGLKSQMFCFEGWKLLL
jgi:hypothetical protein